MRCQRMTDAAGVIAFVEGQPGMTELLRAVAELGLPDAWIGAGFLRNPVWDALHGRAPDVDGLTDVDVVFFDADDVRTERERDIEAALSVRRPGVAWSARNQARMHLRNADAPYRDTEDGVRRWPETATALAARVKEGHVELLAPHGVEDLVGLVLRPTPTTAAQPRRLEAYRQRVRAKGWVQRWPRLTVLGCDT